MVEEERGEGQKGPIPMAQIIAGTSRMGMAFILSWREPRARILSRGAGKL